MSVVTVQRGFSLPTATLSSVAERLLEALQNQTIGAPVVSRLSPTFVADFTAQIALAAKLDTDQSGAAGSVGSLVQAQAEARAEFLHLSSVARRAARFAFRGQTMMLRSEFQVGVTAPRNLPGIVEQGRKLLAACQRSATALEPHGWLSSRTEELAQSVEGLASLSRRRELEAGNKLGVTAERVVAANRLYRQCLTVQNVARLVYPGARSADDSASVAGRSLFLLGEFPPRVSPAVEAPPSSAEPTAGRPIASPAPTPVVATAA